VSAARPPAPSSVKPLPDVVGPNLQVLFCGINPSLVSAERGHHFARPGNRFWPTLELAGFTPRRFAPGEDGRLPGLGIGITNLVDRPTRAAAELSDDELRAGLDALTVLVRAVRPVVVAIVGIGAWRIASGRRDAHLELQPGADVGGRPVWVVPNPSGLNAGYQLPELARLYGELHDYARSAPRPPTGR
jgi:TDG/mug DNA glycosylase family protein